MVLDERTVREKARERHNSDVVARAIRNEERLRFHCVTMLNSKGVAGVLSQFLDYVKGILQSEEKMTLFTTFLRFPMPTTSFVESIFTEYGKVFHGQNFVNTVTFDNTEDQDDYYTYATELLRLHENYEIKAYDAMVSRINCMLVVDMPKVQVSERPEPYFYFLGIENVVSFECMPGTDVLEYVMFKCGDEKLAVIDSESYRIYREDRNLGELVLEHRADHNLGYVPVKFFWKDHLDDPTDTANKCLKKSPVAKVLDDLDYLLFKMISKRIADLGGEYPTTWAYEDGEVCDYDDGHFHCENGFLKDSSDQYAYNTSGGLMVCPVCSKKGYRGAGTHITVPLPETGDPAIGAPVGLITTPVDTLKNVSEDIEALKQYIYSMTVGYDGFFNTNSMSAAQIQSNFENRKAVLCRLKVNLEESERFVIDTCCRLRYGVSYKGCTLDYGTEFYLYNVSQLRDLYKEAKQSGASRSELSYLDEQLIATELRNNPDEYRRLMILRQVEPYRNVALSELSNLMTMDGVVDPVLFKIKLDFPNLIERFERENCKVTEFGRNVSMEQRINKILETLKTYVNGRE